MKPVTPLAIVDVLDGDHARQSFPLQAADGCSDGTLQVRIGRSLDCEISIDDPHLAPEHALLSLGPEPEGRLTLLPSLNGALQNRRRHGAGEQLVWPADGLLQLGHTRLRLRHAAAALAPERAPLHAPRGLGVLLLGLLAAALVLLDTWLGLEPGAQWLAYVGPVLAIGGALLVWAALWALLTQLFQRRFPFVTHLRRALVYLVSLNLLDALLGGLAFAASAPWLMVPAKLLPLVLTAGLVYWHARDVWPRARHVLAMFVLGGLTMMMAMDWTRQQNLQHRWRAPYMSTLLPPPWRAAPLQPVDALLKDAAALRPALDEKSKVDADGNEVDDD